MVVLPKIGGWRGCVIGFPFRPSSRDVPMCRCRAPAD